MRLASLALAFLIAALAQTPRKPVFTWPIAEEKPSYDTPAAARDANLAGTVILYTEITSEGKPANIAVIQSLGLDLDTAAMNALAKATFQPATEGGVPVRIAQSYDVSFPPATPEGWRVRRAGFKVIHQRGDKELFLRKPLLTHYEPPEWTACPAEGGSFPLVFDLKTDGAPSNIRSADPANAAPPAVLKAVGDWRFGPASDDGKKRAVEGHFTLDCGAPPAPADNVFRFGGRTSAPSVIYRVDPEYSEAARHAKFSGNVILSAIVNESGYPEQLRIPHMTGLGLDRQALESVSMWRFRPGTRAGQPVPVRVQIEVNFRLF